MILDQTISLYATSTSLFVAFRYKYNSVQVFGFSKNSIFFNQIGWGKESACRAALA
jgi:hypothetical protein